MSDHSEWKVDLYAPIREAIRPEHASLSADELTVVLGGKPAVLTLFRVLDSPATQQATMAASLGNESRRSHVRFHDRDVPVPLYFDALSQLFAKVAQHTEDETEELGAEKANRPFLERDTPQERADLDARLKTALDAKKWPAALALAIKQGIRDQNALTNLIFFAKHPELPQAAIDPKHPQYKQLTAEWTAILNREVWTAIQAASENPALAVSGAEAADHDKFFWGTTGKRLKQLVANAAAQTGLNPGLLAAIIMAETRNPETYLTSGPVNSYLIGTDDFYEARAAIAARVPAYSKVNWDKNQTPYEHYNDAKTNPRKVKSIDFDSGGDALLATGVYAKFYEVRMREIARSLKGDFDNLPIETRFALTRMAMAAGAAGATPFLKDALAGKDIFVRKPIPVAIYQTQRNASVRTAQALHLSEWIFGIPLATSTQSHEMESEFSHSIAVSNENQESAEGGAVVFERQTPKLIHPAYNHAAAVEYAKQFAFRPCSDGFMLLKDGKYTRVKGDEKISNGGVQQLLNADGSTFTLPDGTAVSQIEMDDCTHFISCCVGQPPGGGGGGIRIPDMWGSHGPYGITRVSISTKDGNRDPDLKLGMIEYLTDHKFARIVAAKTHDESEIKKLEAGDLIAYFDSAEGYRHLALYLGDGKIAAHTISRLGDDWRAPGSGRWRYTLIHFV